MGKTLEQKLAKSLYNKKYAAEHKLERADYNKKYRIENRPKIYAVRKSYDRAHHLKKTYGITQDIYNELYTQQYGKCFLCDIHQEILYVDHSHSTGAVRGLLCGKCNTGLGMFNDSKEVLLKALNYIDRDTGFGKNL